MNSIEDIIKLLEDLSDQTSPPFDSQVLSDMFAVMDKSLHIKPFLSWQDIESIIMHSKVIKMTVAVAFILGTVSLTYYLVHRQGTVSPSPTSLPIITEMNDMVDKPIPSTVNQIEYELTSAQALFNQRDINGLLNLLDTGMDETKTKVAGYLSQLGDTSVIPALKTLAEQWQGLEGDNPFQQAIEQIVKQNRDLEPMETNKKILPQTIPSISPEEKKVTIEVRTIKALNGSPLSDTTINIRTENIQQEYITDTNGMTLVDLGKKIPAYLNITAYKPGYVSMCFILEEQIEETFPDTFEFTLKPGITIGGSVQDIDGNPVANAVVKCHIDEIPNYDPARVLVNFKQTTDASGKWQCNTIPTDLEKINITVSHPEFFDTEFNIMNTEGWDTLIRQEYIMILFQGIHLVGYILDSNEFPIAGAEVWNDHNWNNQTIYKTDADGRFEVSNLKPEGDIWLMIYAEGFAPTQQQIQSQDIAGPMVQVLEKGLSLTGKVVNTQGHPIEGVLLEGRFNPKGRTLWQAVTDIQGGFTWDQVAEEKLFVRVEKESYEDISLWIARDEIADVLTYIVLHEALQVRVTGMVIDGTTGTPIEKFKLVPGKIDGDARNIIWDKDPEKIRWSTNGRYQYTFKGNDPAYALLIEAEGYLPTESRLIDANENEVVIDFTLYRGIGLRGYVRDMQGFPAADTAVHISNDFQHIEITNGKVDNSFLHIQTDDQGWFELEPQHGIKTIIAVNDEGIGITSVEELTQTGQIIVRQWAQVAGSLSVDTQPAIEQEIQIIYPHLTTESTGYQIWSGTETDVNGMFHIKRVMPGRITIRGTEYIVTPGEILELHLTVEK